MKIKNRKSKIKNSLLAFLVFLVFTSCGKWLDGALPQDRNLDEKQFSTETGIHAALNGLYSRLASSRLYGSMLTMTSIELLAHYYYYETSTDLIEFRGYESFRFMSEYRFDDYRVSEPFNAIWNMAYQTIFEINTFIKNLGESEAISKEQKNVFLGEAYGLRAFIHLDLYRIFSGIVYDPDNEGFFTRSIPYNDSPNVVPHTHISPDEYIIKLQQDINLALHYLEDDDPILTVGILDLQPSSDNAQSPVDFTEPAVIFNTYLRNYRMNYYAVRALQARFLMFIGEEQQAAQTAQEILDESFGNGKLFNWANFRDIEQERNRNYIFYEEVIFGITNPDLYANWRNYTSSTSRGGLYAVHEDILRETIFGNDIRLEGDLRRWPDVRTRQWLPSLMDDSHFISMKYENHQFSRYNPKEFFQPLIRTAELWYIIAEAKLKAGDRDGAIEILDEFYLRRGSSAGWVSANAKTDEDVYKFLETEYYKEFYGEGQTWFYLKRNSSSSIISARAVRERNPLTPANFFPNLPQREFDFD